MPLLLSKPVSPTSTYAIWNITETESQLLERIDEIPPEAQPNKRSEWIVTRILVKYLCDSFDLDYEGVGNLDTGKPILINNRAQISITHSFPLAGALINLKKPCGIDIEWPRQKLNDVASKFLNEEEERYKSDLNALCKIWASKEVLFKIHGEKNLSLKGEMNVSFENDWKVSGRIKKNGNSSEHQIAIEPINNYVLAYNI